MADNNNINEKKDTYDKLLTGGNGDLFSDSGFDEMQKAKNYEIGFKLFRAFFWVAYLMSMIIIIASAAFESLFFMITGFSFLALCDAFYLVCAAKAAAAGVMNPKLAKGASKKHICSTAYLL